MAAFSEWRIEIGLVDLVFRLIDLGFADGLLRRSTCGQQLLIDVGRNVGDVAEIVLSDPVVQHCSELWQGRGETLQRLAAEGQEPKPVSWARRWWSGAIGAPLTRCQTIRPLPASPHSSNDRWRSAGHARGLVQSDTAVRRRRLDGRRVRQRRGPLVPVRQGPLRRPLQPAAAQTPACCERRPAGGRV